jgi:hypothetical protein
MPGFIGVRYSEMVSIPASTDYIDVYIFLGDSTVWVADPTEVLTQKEDPTASANVDLLWSYGTVNNVQALTSPDDTTFTVWTSQDGGLTWASVASPNRVVATLGDDHWFGIPPSFIGPIRQTRTHGATWFDLIPLPSGRATWGAIEVTQTHIYAETNPEE